jgi:hypothetical protein
MLWILISAAMAGTCPWSNAPVFVDAGWKTVTVDGVPYSTDAFAAVLFDCGEPEAAAKLQSWQSLRKWTLGLGAAGCCLVGPWLVAPVTGIVGIVAREDMEDLLLDGRSTSSP